MMRALTALALTCLLSVCLQVDPSGACTSFCLDTPDGPVFEANLDLFLGEGLVFLNRRGVSKEGYLAGTTGETARWVSEYGSVTFNLVGRELPWSGMNEAGLDDHDVNLEVFRAFCDKWGIKVSAEGAVELMRLFESFECAP